MIRILTLALGLFCCCFGVKAQTITEMQVLDFGEIAIRGTSDNIMVTVNTNGTFSTNGNTYLISNPERGEYHIDGMPASTAYTITTPASFLISGGVRDFTVDNIVIAPVGDSSDVTGQADFQLGARITSTLGDFFPDGNHSSTFDLTLNF